MVGIVRLPSWRPLMFKLFLYTPPIGDIVEKYDEPDYVAIEAPVRAKARG